MVVRRPGSTASAVPRELRGAQFKIVPIPGKGMGVVATSRIHRGERIMADPPLLVVTEGLTDKSLAALVARLPIPLRRAFFNLAQNTARFGEEKTSLGIVATNGIPYMHHGVRSGGIFPTACRINHSCDANAAYKWHALLAQLTVHASKTIDCGDEITFNDPFGRAH